MSGPSRVDLSSCRPLPVHRSVASSSLNLHAHLFLSPAALLSSAGAPFVLFRVVCSVTLAALSRSPICYSSGCCAVFSLSESLSTPFLQLSAVRCALSESLSTPFSLFTLYRSFIIPSVPVHGPPVSLSGDCSLSRICSLSISLRPFPVWRGDAVLPVAGGLRSGSAVFHDTNLAL